MQNPENPTPEDQKNSTLSQNQTDSTVTPPSNTTGTPNADVLSGRTGVNDNVRNDTSNASLADLVAANKEDKKDKDEAVEEILGDQQRAKYSKENLDEINKSIEEQKRFDEEKRNTDAKAQWKRAEKPSMLDMPPEIEASKKIKLGNARAATNEDREDIKQKAKDGERKESKFVKYGKTAGLAIGDMLMASLGITSRQTGQVITLSTIFAFKEAGKKDHAELKPVFDFLEKQNPPFKKVGRNDGYDKEGNPMSTWTYEGGDPKTKINVNRETIGASNPESKEFFLKCVGEFAKAKNKVENSGKPGEKINLHISGDKEAVKGLQEEIKSKNLKKFEDMPGIKQPETKPPETQVTPPQQHQQTTPSPSRR